ncbi:pyroglutamyl-peptidase [Izhakiella capsodis]|uniref:Pyrrolidone-carboxylate peptidase n=1 Tax=Izhakiella capsodis TaxID=1367852 RepID=A0A1I4UDI5_9GAMM|nr:pyroglutamyl-peptidase I [Izhakiella capsodis]SFM86793.1 pyroglutamyl-peptidase [Izhakiella capsodis]
MKTVLITAFEPFDGETVNPSWEAVRQLDQRELMGATVVACLLPCEFGQSLVVLKQAINRLRPTLVMATGQAGGRSEVSVERIGINIDDARIADNRGRQPVDQPIVPEGPAAYFATLPIKAMVAAIREAGIPAVISQTAGTYVCNHVLYSLLHYLHHAMPEVRGGFIHIPYLPEQVVARQGQASMSSDNVIRALEAALITALSTEHDIRQTGGATH